MSQRTLNQPSPRPKLPRDGKKQTQTFSERATATAGSEISGEYNKQDPKSLWIYTPLDLKSPGSGGFNLYSVPWHTVESLLGIK